LLCLDEVNKEHDELQAQLEEVRAKSEEDFLAMEQVAKECEALTKQIAQSNKLQAAKREEASALKRKANDLKDELATATWALEESEAGVTLDNLRDECSDLEENLQNVKTMCGNVSSSVKAIKSQVVAVEQVKEEAQKYFESHGNYETTAKELGAVQKKSRGKIGSFVSFCYACVIAR